MEQCVEHTNAVTPPQELSDDDRADVSGAAGNKNKSHHIHRYYFGVDTNLGSFQQPSHGPCSARERPWSWGRYFVVQPASALLERHPTCPSVTLKKLPDAAALPPPAVAALSERYIPG